MAYAVTHGLRVVDALIAASALEANLVMVTGNVKHYRVIAGLRIIRFTP